VLAVPAERQHFSQQVAKGFRRKLPSVKSRSNQRPFSVSQINCLIGHFNFPRYVQATQLFRVRLNCDRFHGVCDSYSYCPWAPRLTGQRMCMVTRRPMEPCIIGTNLRLDAMNHPSTSTSYIYIHRDAS
jgi:hypothetical protein